MLNERRMKMKKNFLSIAFMAVFMLMATNSQAQSWSDLFNKDNISKVVNAITGKERLFAIEPSLYAPYAG